MLFVPISHNVPRDMTTVDPNMQIILGYCLCLCLWLSKGGDIFSCHQVASPTGAVLHNRKTTFSLQFSKLLVLHILLHNRNNTFYRTQLSLGSDLLVPMSDCPSLSWNLNDVTLADQVTNLLQTDNANMVIQGNVAMQVTQPGGQVWNKCRWRHLMTKWCHLVNQFTIGQGPLKRTNSDFPT